MVSFNPYGNYLAMELLITFHTGKVRGSFKANNQGYLDCEYSSLILHPYSGDLRVLNSLNSYLIAFSSNRVFLGVVQVGEGLEARIWNELILTCE